MQFRISRLNKAPITRREPNVAFAALPIACDPVLTAVDPKDLANREAPEKPDNADKPGHPHINQSY